LGKRLKQLIEVLGIKQNQFAQNIDVSPSHVSDVLSGRRNNFSIDIIIKIAELYKVNLNWLLTGEGEMFITKPEENQVIRTVSDIKDIGQITGTGWFSNLSEEQKKIVTGLTAVKDKAILRKVSEIISHQAVREASDSEIDRGLNELAGLIPERKRKGKVKKDS